MSRLTLSKLNMVKVCDFFYLRGKFVSFENISCKIKPGCKEHPPWPGGICTKCQPSALTLNRQVNRHTHKHTHQAARRNRETKTPIFLTVTFLKLAVISKYCLTLGHPSLSRLSAATLHVFFLNLTHLCTHFYKCETNCGGN